MLWVEEHISLSGSTSHSFKSHLNSLNKVLKPSILYKKNIIATSLKLSVCIPNSLILFKNQDQNSFKYTFFL